MATALTGAVSCGRCGLLTADRPVTPTGRCPQCDRRWVPAASGSAVGLDVGPLAGVVRAQVGRRQLAHVLDTGPALLGVVLVAGGVVGRVTSYAPVRVPTGLVVGASLALVAYLAVQLLLFARAGRSLGRLALGLRTVDDLTATPVGLGRALAHLGRPGGRRRTVTAALRRGRDPLAAAPAGPASPAESVRTVGAAEATARHSADPARADVLGLPGSEPRPSVAIVLANGERYEIWHALLLGRSPVDPEGGRALLAWPDLSRRLAKTHVLLEWSGTTLWVTDLTTASGTALVSPAGDRTPLVPGVRTAAAVGWTVECGGRTFTVRPGRHRRTAGHR